MKERNYCSHEKKGTKPILRWHDPTTINGSSYYKFEVVNMTAKMFDGKDANRR